MPEKLSTPETPKAKRGRIITILALCGAIGGVTLVKSCSYLDLVCMLNGYDRASQRAKNKWEKIKEREEAKGNDDSDLYIGFRGRNMCYGDKLVSEDRIRCKGIIGNCVGKKEED